MEADKLWSQPLQEVFLTQFRWYFSKSFHESEDLSINICLPQEDYTEYMPSVFWNIINAALWSPKGAFCGYLRLCDLFISSPPIFCVMFCSIAVYVTPEHIISQSISVSASGGESYRGQFAEIRNAALSSPEAEYWYIITGTWHLGPSHVSVLSSLSSASQLPHKCTVLSGCPDADAHQTTHYRLLDALILIQVQGYALINISSPGPGGETQAAHNPYCSVN